ncbi:TPA: hypothetical protein N0F65_000182 [Lagenidium giganteum]|uniref:[acyl-carrier-protein] S-malonyltransferase n=1 Tax=Lagenidium giganteum TaxID=4803 RepID=A0AAV2YQW7_9STRA|nr:TPA: hypothetical protein N0F65_000182 [Lagenidium giganteum]
MAWRAKHATALVFPGQGSQRVGMSKELLENWPRVVADVWEEASEAIKVNLTRLVVDGPQDKLTETQFAQPAILSHSIAVLRVLQQEAGLRVMPDANVHSAMGHSLGEYSALVAAEALPFADAVQLVHFRGRVMQEAVPRGVGAMAALMPLSSADAEDVCCRAAADTSSVCQVANYNSSKQIVISGNSAAVDAAVALAKSDKKVRRAVPLDVSAPFHCQLMRPAATQLADKMATMTTWRGPSVPIVWNTEAQGSIKNSDEMQEALKNQVTAPVQWSQSVDWCLEQGVREFLELGHGGVLTGLIKQHAPKAAATSLSSIDQITAFLKQQQQA